MKQTLVFDATPLIYLAKTRIIEKLPDLETENIIVPAVYREVVEQGVQRGADDALLIKRAIAGGLLKIETVVLPSSFLRENRKLSEADKETLYFCKMRKGVILLADDEEIRKLAEVESIPNHGSLYVLFTLLHQGKITKEELKYTLHEMINVGWYCSIDLYTNIMNKLEKE